MPRGRQAIGRSPTLDDPALLRVIEALARRQARRDYEAMLANPADDARRPLRPL
jgi:hypothetical protein